MTNDDIAHQLDLLPGVPTGKVVERLARAKGDEIRSGKIFSKNSSAIVAVNCFGWFLERKEEFPGFDGVPHSDCPLDVEIEYSMRFPWTGGTHPWLDAAVITSSHLIGVESKRFEPFRDRKRAEFSDAYDRDVWGDNMRGVKTIRDRLRDGALKFQHLDAAQLVKHALGLRTQAKTRSLKPVLVYLFAEPSALDGAPISDAAWRAHREEIARFAGLCEDDEISFRPLAYKEWVASWPEGSSAREHGDRLIGNFDL